MSAPCSFAVIVPLAPGESEWAGLLADFPPTPEDWRIALASGETAPPEFASAFAAAPNVAWMACEKTGRAAQMNEAAKKTTADFLWFVHADARPDGNAVGALRESVLKHPDALHYFPLRFRDGGARMRVNEFGARIRRALFRNPWGDQSLCVSRATFEKIGGYPEDAPYGEDNIFALRARRMKVPLQQVNAQATTSARGYGAGFGDWIRTTMRYQRLWIRQALRERYK